MGQRRKCPRQSLFDFADDRCFIMSLFGRYRRVTGSNRPLFVTLMEQLGESFSQSSSVPSSSTSVPSSDKNIILNKHITLNRHVILNKYVIFKKQGTTFKTFAIATKGSFRTLFCRFFPLGVSPPPPSPTFAEKTWFQKIAELGVPKVTKIPVFCGFFCGLAGYPPSPFEEFFLELFLVKLEGTPHPNPPVYGSNPQHT